MKKFIAFVCFFSSIPLFAEFGDTDRDVIYNSNHWIHQTFNSVSNYESVTFNHVLPTVVAISNIVANSGVSTVDMRIVTNIYQRLDWNILTNISDNLRYSLGGGSVGGVISPSVEYTAGELLYMIYDSLRNGGVDSVDLNILTNINDNIETLDRDVVDVVDNTADIDKRLKFLDYALTGSSDSLGVLPVAYRNDNILSNLRQINTNRLSDIQSKSVAITNVLQRLYELVSTNRIDFSSIGITNLIDYTSLITDIYDSVRFIETNFDDFYSDYKQALLDTSDFYSSNTNLLTSIDIGVSSVTSDVRRISYASIASTNLETRIVNRLDGWDYFYSIFTNQTFTPTTSPFFYHLTRPTFPKNVSVNFVQDFWSPRSRSFSDAVLQYLDIIQYLTANDNNFDYYSAINLSDLYSSFSTFANIYTNNTLKYILNPSSFSTSAFFSPRYYKGFGGNATLVDNVTLRPDLSGIEYIIDKYIPNNLASINNYLYDFYQNGVKVSNFPSFSFTNDVSVFVTNNISLNTTNIVNVSSTNTLDKWDVIASWLDSYSAIEGQSYIDRSVVYSDSDLSTTNTTMLEYISSTGNYLLDNYNHNKRSLELLSSINKSLLRSGDGASDIPNSSDVEHSLSSQKSSLEGSLSSSDVLPDFGQTISDKISLQSLPDKTGDLPDKIVINIPNFTFNGTGSNSDVYQLEIVTERLQSFLGSVRAFFRFVWISLVSLILWFVLHRLWGFVLLVVRYVSKMIIH